MKKFRPVSLILVLCLVLALPLCAVAADPNHDTHEDDCLVCRIIDMIDALPEKNNMRRNELIEDLSTPYDPEAFKKYTQEDTFLYKLSWKFGKKDLQTPDGKPTNYAHMLAECTEDLVGNGQLTPENEA